MAAPKTKVLCECLGITAANVARAIRERGLTSVKQVTACTQAGGGCTSCHPAIRAHIERLAAEQGRTPAAAPVAGVYFSEPSPIFSAK